MTEKKEEGGIENLSVPPLAESIEAQVISLPIDRAALVVLRTDAPTQVLAEQVQMFGTYLGAKAPRACIIFLTEGVSIEEVAEKQAFNLMREIAGKLTAAQLIALGLTRLN